MKKSNEELKQEVVELIQTLSPAVQVDPAQIDWIALAKAIFEILLLLLPIFTKAELQQLAAAFKLATWGRMAKWISKLSIISSAN